MDCGSVEEIRREHLAVDEAGNTVGLAVVILTADLDGC